MEADLKRDGEEAEVPVNNSSVTSRTEFLLGTDNNNVGANDNGAIGTAAANVISTSDPKSNARYINPFKETREKVKQKAEPLLDSY